MGETMTGYIKGNIKVEMLLKILREAGYKAETKNPTSFSNDNVKLEMMSIRTNNSFRSMCIHRLNNKKGNYLKNYIGIELYEYVQSKKEFTKEETLFIKSFFETKEDLILVSLGSNKESEKIISSILNVTGGFIELNDCADTNRENYKFFMEKEKNLEVVVEILDSIDDLKDKVQSEGVRKWNKEKLIEIKDKIKEIL